MSLKSTLKHSGTCWSNSLLHKKDELPIKTVDGAAPGAMPCPVGLVPKVCVAAELDERL
jgi:hypothetical protein